MWRSIAKAGSRTSPTATDTVSVIDIKARKVVSSVRVGKGPNAVSVSP